MSPLSDEDCFTVLKNAAYFRDGGLIDEALGVNGIQIAMKCQGIPLAARVLGANLGLMPNVEVLDATLRSNVWDHPRAEFDIPPALRLSYDHLPIVLKKCFAYCSLFPKNFEIERGRLVSLWIAEGFIQVSETDTCSLEEAGDKCFYELLHRSFLQQSSSNSSYFVMHNLVHDLAQEASSGFCYKLDMKKLQPFPSKTRHYSYVQTGDGDFSKALNGQRCFEKLRTFLALRSSSTENNCGLRSDEVEELNKLHLPSFTSQQPLG